MINRLAGYTGDGFQERRAYINTKNDFNRLSEIKKKNKEKNISNQNINESNSFVKNNENIKMPNVNPIVQQNQYKSSNFK